MPGEKPKKEKKEKKKKGGGLGRFRTRLGMQGTWLIGKKDKKKKDKKKKKKDKKKKPLGRNLDRLSSKCHALA